MTLLIEARRFGLSLPDAGPLLADLDFSLTAGERVGWTGESGSGKTLLASCLLGLQPADAMHFGSLSFAGRELGSLAMRDWRLLRGGEVAMIFQDPASALNPARPVGSQLLEIARRHRIRQRNAARRYCLEVLETLAFDDPAQIFRAYPHRLSGGQQQQILIAMAMICRPRLAILDEPSAALDALTQARLLGQLLKLHEQHGTALWLISHDLGLLAGACERILVIYRGRLMEDAPAEALLSRPYHPYSRLLAASRPRFGDGAIGDSLPRLAAESSAQRPAGCPFAPRCERADSRCRSEMPGWTIAADSAPGSKRRVACFHPLNGKWPALPRDGTHTSTAPKFVAGRSDDHRFNTGSTELLAVRGLKVRHPETDRDCLTAIDFSLKPGEILGVTGVSGAGKSTMARALFGLVPWVEGELFWQGKRLTPKSLRRVAQLLFQNPSAALDPRLYVGWSIAEARGEAGNESWPFARQRAGQAAGGADRQIAELLAAVQLAADLACRYPHQLSIGQRARVAIARALAARPQLLVADEPFAALDAPVQLELIRLLARLNREQELAMIVIAHDLAALSMLADQVIVIDGGRIVEHTTMSALLTAPAHPLSRRLVAAAWRMRKSKH